MAEGHHVLLGAVGPFVEERLIGLTVSGNDRHAQRTALTVDHSEELRGVSGMVIIRKQPGVGVRRQLAVGVVHALNEILESFWKIGLRYKNREMSQHRDASIMGAVSGSVGRTLRLSGHPAAADWPQPELAAGSRRATSRRGRLPNQGPSRCHAASATSQLEG